MRLNKNIVYRYESRIMNGKTFIFNLDNERILVSNKLAYDLLKIVEDTEPGKEELLVQVCKDNHIINKADIEKFIEDMVSQKIVCW